MGLLGEKRLNDDEMEYFLYQFYKIILLSWTYVRKNIPEMFHNLVKKVELDEFNKKGLTFVLNEISFCFLCLLYWHNS